MTIEEAYKNFENEIVLQAIRDYTRAIADGKQETIKECEDFFNSAWGNELSKLDGNFIIKKLKNGVESFTASANKEFASRKEKLQAFKCPICNGDVTTKLRCFSPRKHKYALKASCNSCLFYVWDEEKMVVERK